MNLKSIRIENLRAFRDETVSFDNYTCFVGGNGSGKSTILTALNIFFRENSNASTDMLSLSKEDFHKGDVSKPIRITLTFGDLSSGAKDDFAAYVRHDHLVISAVAEWDEACGSAKVVQIGERLGIPAFKQFYDACTQNKRKDELVALYEDLVKIYSLNPKYRSKAAAELELRNYESDHSMECSPLQSPTEFYGYTGGEHLLQKYVQWIYVPAVKDASDEEEEGKQSCLSRLLERAVASKLTFSTELARLKQEALEQYQSIVQENQVHLDGLSNSLAEKLKQWAHPDTRMKVEFATTEKSVQLSKPPAKILAGEGMFDGAISRFGHGLQRCFLLAILQEISSSSSDGWPRLLLGIEEPELYQHPPQARHLGTVLSKISRESGQVIVSTHSPHFVTGRQFESVRVVRRRKGSGDACVSSLDFTKLNNTLNAARGGNFDKPAATIAKINQVLQPSLNEIFFAPVIVLVEGLEDVAIITAHLELTGKMNDFRKYGCHLVPVNGKDALFQPIAVLRQLGIPCFCVFDSDGDELKEDYRRHHERDNRAILYAMDHASAHSFPTSDFWCSDMVMWASNIGDRIEAEYGIEDWRRLRQQVIAKYQLQAKGDLKKNAMVISYMFAEAQLAKRTFPVLERLVNEIIDFAEQAR